MSTACKIAVVGSINADLTVYTPVSPTGGQTVVGSRLVIGPGGKGANQAIAALRAGGEVVFLGRIGQDFLSETLLAFYREEGLSTAHILPTEGLGTGTATIIVEESTGENRIVVVAGANAALSPADVYASEEALSDCGALLCQNEIPEATVQAVMALSARKQIPLIYNPAPFRPMQADLLRNAAFITPNETEAIGCTGFPVSSEREALAAGRKLLALGAKNAVITLGSRGAALVTPHWEGIIPPLSVTPVDTTGAGDAFNGALAVAVAEGMPPQKAVSFANAAAGLSVTKAGAAVSMPYRKEIDAVWKE